MFSGGAWDDWSTAGAAIGDGEWGIRATVSLMELMLLIMYIEMVHRLLVD